MTLTSRLPARLARAAAALAAATFAFAGAAYADNPAPNNFTGANTSVDNTFTLDYAVSGTPQDTITNDPTLAGPGVVLTPAGPTSFTVDRKIDLVVTQQNSINQVAASATGEPLIWELINEGNDNQSYSVDLIRTTGDAFDATPNPATIAYEVFSPADVSIGTGTVAEVALGTATAPAGGFTIDVPPDHYVVFTLTSDIPTGILDGEQDPFILVAETRDPVDWLSGPPASPGTTATGSAGALTLDDSDASFGAGQNVNAQEGEADNVLADGSNPAVTQDADNDGRYGDTGVYEIVSPDLVATKTVTTIATDPAGACATMSAVTGSEQYYVPEACVEYVIDLENTGSVAAEDVQIDDLVPAELTVVAVSLGVAPNDGFVDDAVTPANTGTVGPLLTIDGAAVGSASFPIDCTTTPTCDIALRDTLLGAGATGQIVIRATVD